jgi:hypothetical protein
LDASPFHALKTGILDAGRVEGQFIQFGHIRHFRDDHRSARSPLFIPEFNSTEHAMDQRFSFGPFAHSCETSAFKIENLHGQSDPWIARLRGAAVHDPEVLERPSKREGVFTFELPYYGRE